MAANANANAAINLPSGVKTVFSAALAHVLPGKGADVASASTLELPKDGDYAVVTGTTGITRLKYRPPGTRVRLRFAAAPPLTHHATYLILQGAANWTPTAGDISEFVSEGGSVADPEWRESNRHTATAAASGSQTVTAGEALSANDLVYQDIFQQRDSNKRWWKVDADATGPGKISPVLGIALTAAAGAASTFTCQIAPGRVAGFSSLTAGLPVYASATAGGVTQTVPAIPATGTQAASRLIGIAASATEIDFNPEDDTTFLARNSALASGSSITVEHFTDSGAREREPFAYIVVPGGSYTQSAESGSNADNMNTGQYLAQSFQVSTTDQITKVKIHPYQANSATLDVRLETNNAGAPSGTLVAANVQKTGVSINTTSPIEVTLDAAFTPAASTTYWIVLRNISSNQINVWKCDNTTSQYASGTRDANGSQAGDYWFGVFQASPSLDEPVLITSETISSGATDRATCKFADSAGAKADTKTTLYNRTNATRDLAAVVVV